MEDLQKLAVNNFREYLRIPSVHPNVNYEGCVQFLKKQAKSLELPVEVHYFFPKKPIVVIKWIGKEPQLPSILLNGHMDVVPVFEDKWTYDPFAAHMDDEGNIYARGAQDMKCVSIQYLEAIRKLKKKNVTLKRTIYVSFVPDEEIGGIQGMKAFVESRHFKDLNVGFALDEGLGSTDNVLPLYYGERTRWVMKIHCTGNPGHGSLLLDNTAGEKIMKVLNKFYEFREREQKKLENNPDFTLGDVTTVNLTILEGGVQSNVIPSELTFTVDCRIAVTFDLKEFEEMINKWCKDAGEGVWIEYHHNRPLIPVTKLDDSNIFWMKFKKTINDMNFQLNPQIFPAATDSRYIRELSIPALGFSPMPFTPLLLHDHDEYLNKDVFLKGIDIYCNVISAVANV